MKGVFVLFIVLTSLNDLFIHIAQKTDMIARAFALISRCCICIYCIHINVECTTIHRVPIRRILTDRIKLDTKNPKQKKQIEFVYNVLHYTFIIQR